MSLELATLLRAPGLRRLLELEGERRFLFHGSRYSTRSSHLYPSSEAASTDPERVRGFFVPSVGLLVPQPLVTYVFPCSLLAALLALLQTKDGVCAVRVDDFPDGTAAVFLGENHVSEGSFREVMARVATQPDSYLLEDYRVEVVRRDRFARDRLDFPMPGVFVSTELVAVEEQVQLSAGDVRALAAMVNRPLIAYGNATDARRDPFTGPFSSGGHLQFDPNTGERVAVRIPTSADRAAAVARAQLRGQRWLKRTTGRLLYGAKDENPKQLAPKSAFGQAVRFIEERCTAPLSVPQIAGAAQLSTRHLHLLFRQVLGCTPLEYAAQKRLDVAEKLIAESALSISAIAEQCGFAEQGSLTRSLKRRRGVTPMALRKTARAKDKR